MLVTGASGFLGEVVRAELLARPSGRGAGAEAWVDIGNDDPDKYGCAGIKLSRSGRRPSSWRPRPL
jgi:hypothetical protein